MKTVFVILLILISLSSFGQETVNLKLGNSVNMDGIISQSEWTDADSIEISAPDSENIKIYFKHDGENFLAAFSLSNLAVNQYKIPEVLFDTYNDKSATWQNDDWWFHVSAQDCEANGTYDVWDGCAIYQPDWQGIPNFGIGDAPPIDTIELKIPWQKINVEPEDTIGFAFDFWISDDLRLYWPESALISNPSTWVNLIISDPASSIEPVQNNIINRFIS